MCPTDFPKGYIQLEAQQQISRQSNKGSEQGRLLSLGKWVGMAAALAVLFCQSGCWVLDLRNKAAVSLDESAANGSAGSVAILGQL